MIEIQTLWTISHGSGVPILLSNGGPGCCDYLAPVAELFPPGIQVIRWEQRGCGRSTGSPPYTIDACLQDMEAIRRHYRIEPWIVAGHSWGADLALIYALQYPQNTLGLICIAGGRVHNDREWHRIYCAKRDQGLEKLPTYAFPPNLKVNEQLNADWQQYIHRPQLLRDLAKLDRPALFLYGNEDIRPSWPVEQVAQLLPNARLHLIKGANHYIWNTHSEEMRQRIGEFLQPWLTNGNLGPSTL
jgi:proline iminopeptidase